MSQPTCVAHLEYFRGSSSEFDEPSKIDDEGTGLLLEHCRKALGGMIPFWSPISPIAKIAEVVIVRYRTARSTCRTTSRG